MNESCRPELLRENTESGYMIGRCRCSSLVRSYQNFCSECGARLEWKGAGNKIPIIDQKIRGSI